jgi:hypothetical protein
MSEDTKPARASLHGYQPLVVDENSLSDEKRREAIVGAVAQPRAWSRHITRNDWDLYEQEIDEIKKQHEILLRETPGLFYVDGSRVVPEKHNELVQRGTMRAVAREKYGHIWLGDGPPPWAR